MSGNGLTGGDFAEAVVAVSEAVDCEFEFELEENLELMLDIHELRLPSGATFGSLEAFAEPAFCGSAFSEPCRCTR